MADSRSTVFAGWSSGSLLKSRSNFPWARKIVRAISDETKRPNQRTAYAESEEDEERAEITEEEFEEYMVKNGAAGSFMVFRSTSKKEEELGLEEL